MQNLKLSTIGRACVVDSDEAFLRAFSAMDLGGKVLVEFSEPGEAVQRLLADNAKLRAYERKLDLIFSDENVSRRLQALIDWLQDESRHEIIDIVFCSYGLPLMNGARILGEIRPSRMRRVLLASAAEQKEAIQAMNSGVVDAYVDKNAPNLNRDITSQIARGPRVAFEMLWRGLDYDLGQMLFLPGVHAGIHKIMAIEGVIEHVLVPSPWGFLARTKDNRILWMQLETHESQIGAIEILRDEGWEQSLLEEFIAGEKAACIEARPLLGIADDSPEFPCADMVQISDDPWLGISVFQVKT